LTNGYRTLESYCCSIEGAVHDADSVVVGLLLVRECGSLAGLPALAARLLLLAERSSLRSSISVVHSEPVEHPSDRLKTYKRGEA
jgi:hypothetical protein